MSSRVRTHKQYSWLVKQAKAERAAYKIAASAYIPDGPEVDWEWATMGDDIMDAYSDRLWSEHYARQHQQGVLELFIELTAREIEEHAYTYADAVVVRTAELSFK